MSNRTYGQLVAERSLLIETSRPKATARRLEVEEWRQPEQAQLTRLRALSNFLELERHSPRLRDDYEKAPCDYRKDN
jgi:hypothetical protein